MDQSLCTVDAIIALTHRHSVITQVWMKGMSLSLATGMQISCSTNTLFLVASEIDLLIDRLPVSGADTPISSTFTRE